MTLSLRWIEATSGSSVGPILPSASASSSRRISLVVRRTRTISTLEEIPPGLVLPLGQLD
jgi:hypothetical protein